MEKNLEDVIEELYILKEAYEEQLNPEYRSGDFLEHNMLGYWVASEAGNFKKYGKEEIFHDYQELPDYYFYMDGIKQMTFQQHTNETLWHISIANHLHDSEACTLMLLLAALYDCQYYMDAGIGLPEMDRIAHNKVNEYIRYIETLLYDVHKYPKRKIMKAHTNFLPKSDVDAFHVLHGENIKNVVSPREFGEILGKITNTLLSSVKACWYEHPIEHQKLHETKKYGEVINNQKRIQVKKRLAEIIPFTQ